MFDHATFDAITGGDPLIAREIADLFKTDSAELLANLGRAIRERNGVEINRLAHTLKSSSGSIGALDASELARKIEADGLAAAAELFQPLSNAVSVAVEAMEATLTPH